MLPVPSGCEVLLEKASATMSDGRWLSRPCPALPFLANRPLHPGASPSASWAPLGWRRARGGGAGLPARSCRLQLQRGGAAGGRRWCHTAARSPAGRGGRARLAPLPPGPGAAGATPRPVTAAETPPPANSAGPRGAPRARWKKALASHSRSFPRKAAEPRFKGEFEAKDREFSFCAFFFF